MTGGGVGDVDVGGGVVVVVDVFGGGAVVVVDVVGGGAAVVGGGATVVGGGAAVCAYAGTPMAMPNAIARTNLLIGNLRSMSDN